jgi:hypothetical protein
VEGEEIEREDERKPLEDRREELDSVHVPSLGRRASACYLPTWERERAEGALVKVNTLWLWPLMAGTRFRAAVHQHWKRILVGAFVGWLFAVVGGAFALAWLEIQKVITHSTADDLGIVLVLYGVGVGALNAYALRPVRQ